MPAALAVAPAGRDTDPTTLVPPPLRRAVLAWYDARGRTLPFRASRDPYAILVSETMAQQTQIARAAEKWAGFLDAFPTLAALAVARPADVLRAWRGLGYNRRAINLRRAAQEVVANHGGRLPERVDQLERLPGIGPYTARAVAAIAFGHPVGAVDTNVRRVLGRVAGDELSARGLQALADAVVPEGRAAAWTHAVMDVGATFCRSRRPDCGGCPARPWCRYAAGTTGTVPAPAARTATRATGRFTATSRWLRGRILERLRNVPDDGWTAFPGTLGEHDAAAVGRALKALAADGLLEFEAGDPPRARLPIA